MREDIVNSGVLQEGKGSGRARAQRRIDLMKPSCRLYFCIPDSYKNIMVHAVPNRLSIHKHRTIVLGGLEVRITKANYVKLKPSACISINIEFSV